MWFRRRPNPNTTIGSIAALDGCGVSDPHSSQSDRVLVSCTDNGECPAGMTCDPKLFICVSNTDTSTGCASDDDCNSDEICESGNCRNGCRTNGDCSGDMECSGESLTCINPAGNSCPAGERCCSNDDNCFAGEACVGGVCRTGSCSSSSTCPGEMVYSGGSCICLCDGDIVCECTSDNHCLAGQSCVRYMCVNDSYPVCDIDSDCRDSELCMNGTCTHVPCTDNSHCSAGEDCVRNVCVDDGCDSDNECSAGYICLGRVCTYVDPPCLTDFDCPGDTNLCRNNECVRVQCVDAGDCAANQQCVNDMCTGGPIPPGDCTPITYDIQFYDSWPVVTLSRALTQSVTEFDVYQDGWYEGLHTVRNVNSLTFSECAYNTRSSDLAIGAVRWNLAFCMGEGSGMCNPNDSACVGREVLGTATLNQSLISNVVVTIDGVSASLGLYNPPTCEVGGQTTTGAQCGQSCANSR